jgi:hypothetical protein
MMLGHKDLEESDDFSQASMPFFGYEPQFRKPCAQLVFSQVILLIVVFVPLGQL